MHLPAPGGPKSERASLGSHQSAPRHRARFTLGQPRGKGSRLSGPRRESAPPEGERPPGGRAALGRQAGLVSCRMGCSCCCCCCFSCGCCSCCNGCICWTCCDGRDQLRLWINHFTPSHPNGPVRGTDVTPPQTGWQGGPIHNVPSGAEDSLEPWSTMITHGRAWSTRVDHD